MMKISDPIMFGHGFKIFFKDLFVKHTETFAELKIQPNQGLSDLERVKSQVTQKRLKSIYFLGQC